MIPPGANPQDPPSACPASLRGAAGPGYAGEWALFCDYAAATDQPALPTTVAALAGFLTALPARPATVARRVRAIAAAHRHAGHLLTRPDHGPAALEPAPQLGRPRTDSGLMIAACATRGWPAGLTGTRDAFLIVLTETLGHTHHTARELRPTNVIEPAQGRQPISSHPPRHLPQRRADRAQRGEAIQVG